MNASVSSKRKLRVLLSLLLIPGIFIFHNVNLFGELLFYNEAIVLCIIYLLLPLCLYAGFRKLVKLSIDLSALLVVLLTFLFFFFGAVQDFFAAHTLTRLFSKTYILPFLFIAPCIYLLAKKPRATNLLNSVFALLFFFLLGEVAVLLFSLANFRKEPKIKGSVSWLHDNRKMENDSLNVYHIIFDSYTNSTTLQTLFQYKNPIDSFLRSNGFYVAGRTKSNYNFTPYSLAATLGLNYISLDSRHRQQTFTNFLAATKAYQRNPIFDFFKNRGFSVSHFSLLDNYDHLDQLGTFAPKSPFYSLRNQTLERVFLNPWIWHKLFATAHHSIPPAVETSLRKYKHYNQQAAAHVFQSLPGNQRQYNFTHFFLPHEPYVLAKASIDSLQLGDLMDHSNGYIKQVEYANKLIIQLVNELKKNRHNIIIIQGDHGFRKYDFSKYSPMLQFEALNAIYFPDGDYHLLYDSISPVNTYRVVLNQYFHQNLTLLRDEQFIAEE